MEKIVYKHNRTIIVMSIWASLFLLILSSVHTYQIFNQYGFNNNSFFLGLFVSIFFIIDIIIMYYFFAHQTIVIDPESKTIKMSHINKVGSTSATINFDQIKDLNLVEINKNNYDIKISLKNNQDFLLFAFGDYCPKDRTTISQELELIKKAISYDNNFFILK